MTEYQIWTEKYRPTEFSDVVGQENIIERISAFVDSRQIPHLMFAGPAGCGKSTISIIIAKKLFGSNWRQNFLELNSSDERGINVIRSKVKDFARTKSVGNIPYKIIFLDEADALTADAQNALRRTMESYSNSCRFFLSCNYSSKIIEPLQSRCCVFRFKTISDESIKKRLDLIIGMEKVSADSDAIDAICKLSEGDIRKAINILQTAAINTKNITEKAIYDVASIAEPKEVKNMLEISLKGNFLEARKILNNMILKDGICGQDIIKQIMQQIYSIDLTEKEKVNLIEKVGEFEFRINQGGNEQIQLESLLAQFALFRKE
ncbi:MAG: replication factor C small subunit [Nanoarchaeota archaeon]|nr:replication factor C small subunit [Nanoarchaeota archaeon]